MARGRGAAGRRPGEESGLNGGASSALALPPERRCCKRSPSCARQGRHEEADKALAEFRKRYPDYRISDEMREKVERPKRSGQSPDFLQPRVPEIGL